MRAARITPLILAILAASGSHAATVTTVIAGFTVVLDDGTGIWSVTPAGASAPVLEGPGTCTTVGAASLAAVRVGVGAAVVKRAFGNFRVHINDRTGRVAWRSVCGATPVATIGFGIASLTWPDPSIPGDSIAIRFAPAGSDLAISLVHHGSAVDAGEIAFASPAGESFFGLGTQSFGMDLRGGLFPLWTQEQGIGKPPNGGFFPLQNFPEAAYAPMGIWHSSAGYTAVLTRDVYTELDLAKTFGDRVLLRTYPGLPGLVLLSGATARDRVARLGDFVGRPTDPPAWVFAPWNDAVGGPDRLHDVAALLRTERIPSSAIWSEDWAGGQQTPFGYRLTYAWEWDPVTYPDLPADVAALHAAGFAFLCYFNPFVLTTTRMWTEGLAGGYLIRNAQGGPYVFQDPGFRDSGMVDLTNAGARAWLTGYLTTAAANLAIDGWMADYAEWLPSDAVLASGIDPFTYHNRYPLDWQRINRDALAAVHASGTEPPNNWSYFARSGWASTGGGTAGIAPLVWAGDQNTDWGHDDGFPTVLPIACNAGLAGVSIVGSDIAGYTEVVSPPTTRELFFRWASLGAFHPLMRTHHGSDQSTNWSFDRDRGSLVHYRRLALLHTLLYPSFRELMKDAIDDGLPLTRHPWLVEPQRPGLWQTQDYEMFLGDDVLIAPVLVDGARTRTVRLPASGWWPLFGQAPVTAGAPGPGATWIVPVRVPLDAIPVFARPGTILPLLAEAVDSFYGATDPGVTDLGDVDGRYRLALYPDSAGDLRATRLRGETLQGSGWPQSPPAWSQARLGGRPLLPCSMVPSGVSCYDADSATIVGQNLVLDVGGAHLEITGPDWGSYRIAIARAGWGSFALPDTPAALPGPTPPTP